MSTSIVLTILALATMAAVRLVLAVVTGEVRARWLAAPLLWAAAITVGASGCVDTDDGQQIDAGDEPDAPGEGIDATAPPDAAIDASPDAAPSPLIEARLTIGPDGDHDYAMVVFYVNCPDGAPEGPHDGAIELYSNLGLVDIVTFEWTCDFSWHQSTWFNQSCGLDMWARAVITHPVTGEPAYQLSETKPTRECAQ